MNQPAAEADRLAEQVSEFNEHVVAFTAEVAMLRYEVRTEKHSRRVLAGVVLVMALALSGVTGIVFQNRATLHRLATIQAQVTETNRELVECTTAGTAAAPHPCYDRAQERSTQQISTAIAQIVAAVRTQPSTPGGAP